MDDFLALAQGHGGQRNHVRATIFHAVDQLLLPLQPSDSPFRKQPISMKKLHKEDAKWSTRKLLLGWIVDTVAETIPFPTIGPNGFTTSYPPSPTNVVSP
jgi:hypothetical protein